MKPLRQLIYTLLAILFAWIPLAASLFEVFIERRPFRKCMAINWHAWAIAWREMAE